VWIPVLATAAGHSRTQHCRPSPSVPLQDLCDPRPRDPEPAGV
jgi:hypothetical protein